MHDTLVLLQLIRDILKDLRTDLVVIQVDQGDSTVLGQAFEDLI